MGVELGSEPGAASVADERFAGLLASLPDAAVIVDAAGRIAALNALAAALFGYSRDELIRRPAGFLLPDALREEHDRRIAAYLAQPPPRPRGTATDMFGLRRDGTVFALDISWISLPAPDDGFICYLVRDQSDRDRALQAALRASDEWFRTLVNQSSEAIFLAGADLRFREVNPAACEMLGYDQSELLSLSLPDVLAPSDVSRARRELGQLTHGSRVTTGWRFLRKTGGTFQGELSGRYLPDDGLLGFVRDVTRRKQAEQLASNRAMVRAFIEYAPAAVAMLDADLRYIAVTRRWLQDYDLGDRDIIGQHHYDVFPQLRDMPHWQAIHQRCLAGAVERREEDLFIHADGRTEWLRWEVRPWRDPRGAIGGIIMHTEVITERKLAEHRLRESERLFRGLVEASPVPMVVIATDAGDRVLLMNARFTETFGYSLGDIPDIAAWWPRAYPDPAYRAAIQKAWSEAVAAAKQQGVSSITPITAHVTCRDGSTRDVEVHMATVANRSLVLFSDFTERKRAEELLRRSEERYRLIVENQTEFIVKWRPDGTRTFVNDRYCRTFGLREQDCLGTSFLPLVAPEFREAIQRKTAALSPAAPEFTDEHLSLVPGGPRWQQWTNRGIFDAEGKLIEILSSGRDITERKRLEEQLRQSQKMQAVGQLAGGIAHDFNNLLTVISSCVALLLDDTEPGQPHHADLIAIRDASDRAAQLTRQLLLFSRKAVSASHLLDLNQMVQRASQMLLRLIGENITVEMALEAPLPAVKGDPAQFEQMLLNLALNSRDAMPNGGVLTLATRAVEIPPGDPRLPPNHRPAKYVQLLVGDNGIGMSAEVQAHLFEPFFTTKGVGKGTGLGLATVFGIVEGSGGFISVSSAPDAGTMVYVFLPAIAEAPSAGLEVLAKEGAAERGHETVLLVEDEDGVRRVAERILTDQGYRVIAASSGEDALGRLASLPHPIDILVTDEVMPGMSGRTLAEIVRRQLPGCPVLFVSGHSETEVRQPWQEAGAATFLQKPFTPTLLAKRVRELLDGRG